MENFLYPQNRSCTIIYGRETSDDEAPVVTQAQILTVDEDGVRKSGFYLWGVTSPLCIKPDSFESRTRKILAGFPKLTYFRCSFSSFA